MFAALSNSGSPAVPMKLVGTPRPEKKDWKSMVGPAIVALRPPAHSTCATLRPIRSAEWWMYSAWSTPGSNAAVRFANGWPLRWKVLLVEPWTPGHAPVARLYQPAPVLGGAWVRRPFPLADVPFFRKSDMVGMSPCAAYRATMSCLMPSAAKNTAFCTGDFAWADVFTPAEVAAGTALHPGEVGGPCRESRERRDGDDRDECHASHPLMLPFVSIGISDGVREPGAGRTEPSSTSNAAAAG